MSPHLFSSLRGPVLRKTFTVPRLVTFGLLMGLILALGLPATLGAAEPAEKARLRAMLMAYEGTSRAALESLGPDVAGLLRDFVDDPAEPLRARRQGAKALGLFPTETTFRFVEARVVGAPASLQGPLLVALGDLTPGREARVAVLVGQLLESPRVGVRQAAVSLAERVGPTKVRSALQQRLEKEQEPGVRRALQRALANSDG